MTFGAELTFISLSKFLKKPKHPARYLSIPDENDGLMRNLLFIVFLGTLNLLSAQTLIKVSGTITDAENKEGVPGVNVFLNNTTFKALTDLEGKFEFYAKPGTYQLVVYSHGYDPVLEDIEVKAGVSKWQIEIRPLTYDLEHITITDRRSREWYDNLEIFKQALLGNTFNGQKTKILNPTALVLERKGDRLIAQATDVLKIENPRLKYQIEYILVDFELDLKKKTIRYEGYPAFTDLMKTTDKKTDQRRKVAYLGSYRHWVQSLLSGTSVKNGYEMYRMIMIPNPAIPSHDTLTYIRNMIELYQQGAGPAPSSQQLELLGQASLPPEIEVADSVLWRYWEELRFDQQGGWLSGPQRLKVVYKKERPSSMYALQMSTFGDQQISTAHIATDTLRLDPRGLVNPSEHITFTGYMGWERLGDMLPLEYESVE